MTNKKIISNKIKDLGYELGIYHKAINKIDDNSLNELLESIEFEETTDIDINLDGVDYVIELAFVDNEADIMMLTKRDYIQIYGNERYELD